MQYKIAIVSSSGSKSVINTVGSEQSGISSVNAKKKADPSKTYQLIDEAGRVVYQQ